MDHVTTPVIMATVVATGMGQGIAPLNAMSHVVMIMDVMVALAIGAVLVGPIHVIAGVVAGEDNMIGRDTGITRPSSEQIIVFKNAKNPQEQLESMTYPCSIGVIQIQLA